MEEVPLGLMRRMEMGLVEVPVMEGRGEGLAPILVCVLVMRNDDNFEAV
jgi:hypothetical protein